MRKLNQFFRHGYNMKHVRTPYELKQPISHSLQPTLIYTKGFFNPRVQRARDTGRDSCNTDMHDKRTGTSCHKLKPDNLNILPQFYRNLSEMNVCNMFYSLIPKCFELLTYNKVKL